MTQLDEKQRAGIEFIGGIMGSAFGDAFRESAESNQFSADIARMAAGWAFHDAWQHPGIARREKSIATISALIAGNHPRELKNHVKIGLANGLTAKDLEGVLVQLTPYVGFPCIATAQTAMIEALREADAFPERVRTSQERGLL